MRQTPFKDPNVRAVFDAYPLALRKRLLALRDLILTTARETGDVGPVTETLKWGQPAYVTEKPQTGTTIRIDALKGGTGYAMYVHCQSRLVPAYRELYPDVFAFEGDRALHFSANEEIPRDELRHCIELALTYHVRPKAV